MRQEARRWNGSRLEHDRLDVTHFEWIQLLHLHETAGCWRWVDQTSNSSTPHRVKNFAQSKVPRLPMVNFYPIPPSVYALAFPGRRNPRLRVFRHSSHNEVGSLKSGLDGAAGVAVVRFSNKAAPWNRKRPALVAGCWRHCERNVGPFRATNLTFTKHPANVAHPRLVESKRFVGHWT